MQNVPLLSTHSSDRRSSSVHILMRPFPNHLLPLASGAQRSPLIHTAKWTRSEGWPRCIQCYKNCFNDSGVWCWNATTQVTSDDAPSQRQGCRGVFLFFPSKLVHVKVGSLCPRNPYGKSVCLTPITIPVFSITCPFAGTTRSIMA